MKSHAVKVMIAEYKIKINGKILFCIIREMILIIYISQTPGYMDNQFLTY